MTFNTQSPRTLSIFSNKCDEKCDEEYSARVQYDNMVEDDQIVPSDSPQLEYATSSSQGN